MVSAEVGTVTLAGGATGDVVPVLSITYVKSCDGILRLAQMVSCLVSFVLVQSSVKCTYSYNIQLCVGPSIHVFRLFSAVSLLLFLLVLFVHLLHLYSIDVVCFRLPWSTLRLIQNGACAVLMFLVSSILAGSAFGYELAIASAFFGYVSSLLFTYQLAMGIVCPGDRTRTTTVTVGDAASRRSSVSSCEFTPEGVTVVSSPPCCELNSITRKASFDSQPVQVEPNDRKSSTGCVPRLSSSSCSSRSSNVDGCLQFLSSDGDLQASLSTSELSDKRSWVITSSTCGRNVTNGVVDDLSTANYTVDVSNDG